MDYRYDKSVDRMISKEEYLEENIGGLPNTDLLEKQWENLPTSPVAYDSTVDTLLHIKRVNELLGKFATVLIRRGSIHDKSKLESPEKEIFDIMTPKLKSLTYGSDEYKESLKELGVALQHHYEANSHHPEHYGKSGVNGMDLFDLIEMFLDWKAASERHENGDIFNSIRINKDRFNLSDQIVDIFINHAARYF